MTAAVEHFNPEGMHKSPVFSQGIVISASARTLIVGGQNGIDADGQVVSNNLARQGAKAVDNLIKVLEARLHLGRHPWLRHFAELGNGT
jgi:hypothetical protein